jgi:membrane associated rhomboid family serine protease
MRAGFSITPNRLEHMNTDYLVIIAAFILGALIVGGWSKRPAARKEQDAAGSEPEPAPEPAPVQEPGPVFDLPPHAASGPAAIPVTLALVAICVAIAAISKLGDDRVSLLPYLIATPGQPGLSAVLSGEVWRLLTPAFIHFGVVHLLFNLLWLWDLGGLLERKKGSGFLLGFVAAVGIAANLAQLLVTGNPFFGGMSGVVYGMLGYVWMHGRVNPRFGVTLNNQTVVIMLGWFALCWAGVLGPIANWAHTAGLALGVALGAMKPGGHIRE